MSHHLPLFPRLVFHVLEPLSTLAGWAYAIFLTQKFTNEQHPSLSVFSSTTASGPIPPTTALVTTELGNCYLILCMMGVAILGSPSCSQDVVRRYLCALLAGDIGHLLMVWRGLGTKVSIDVMGWNLMTWGNLGATIFLMVIRIAYLTGLFGKGKPTGLLRSKTEDIQQDVEDAPSKDDVMETPLKAKYEAPLEELAVQETSVAPTPATRRRPIAPDIVRRTSSRTKTKTDKLLDRMD